MSRAPLLHLLLLGAMTAALLVVVPPPADAASACDGGTVELGIACTVDVDTVGDQPVVGTIDNDGGVYVVKTLATDDDGDFVAELFVSPTPGDTGAAVCSAASLLVTCDTAGGGGSLSVFVEDHEPDGTREAGDTGTAIVYVNDLDAPENCETGAAPEAWGTAGTTFDVEAGSAGCRAFTVGGGRYLVQAASDAVDNTVMRTWSSTGAGQCLTNPFELDCTLAAGSYVLFADAVLQAATGRFHVYDRASTSGCTSIGTAFEAAPSAGTLTAGEWECHTPSTTGADPVLIGAVDSEALLQVGVLDAPGDAQCEGTFGLVGASAPCPLDGTGTHKLVVGPNGPGQSGAYGMVTAQTTAPRSGCRDHELGTTDDVVAADSPRLHCFAFDADAGETITAQVSRTSPNDGGSAGQPVAVDGAGANACPTFGELLTGCTLDTAGPYAFVVATRDGAGPVAFDLTSDCGSEDACGTGEALLTSVTPDEIGTDGTSTITVTGQNLQDTQRVELVGPGGTYTSVEQDDVDAGQVSSAVFELDGATPGSYDVRHVTADQTSVLEDAITITATEGADISVSISGGGQTRPDRPVTLTIQVTNDGNVDALGVPVFFEVPAGAEVEFVGMDVLRPDVPDGFGDFAFGDVPPTFDHSNGVFAGGATDGSGNATGGGGYVSTNDMPVFTEVYPLIVPFVPARGRITITARVTPTDTGNQSVSATGGECLLGDPHAPDGDEDQDQTDLEKCLESAADAFFSIADLAIGIVPGGDCATDVAQGASSAIRSTYDFATANPSDRNNIAFAGDMLLNGIGTAGGCLNELNVPAQVALTAYDAFNAGYDTGTAIADCIGTPQWIHDLFAFFSFDPNDITGPSGVGDLHHVLPSRELGYTVRFENDPEEATAPAQRVTVEVPIDADLDGSTIEITSFGFGDVVVSPLLGALPFHEEVDLAASETPSGVGALRVDVDADVTGAALEVTFDTRAPDGGEPGVLDGFLPPNEASPEGEGFLVYAVDGDLADTDVVTATAEIVFDTNDPIVTNTWSNTVDGRAPSTTVATPTALAGSPRVTASWAGDDGTGAGIDSYDVDVSVDGGTSYERWLDDTRLTSAEYVAPRGTTARFRVRATDRLGQVGTPDTSTPISIDDDAIDRLAGGTRVDTALAISRASFREALTVVLARADDYPDALAGAPLAYRLGAPLLLTDGEVLSPGVLAEIGRLGTRRVVVLGGTAAISDAVVAALSPEPGDGEVALDLEVERIAGASRFDTAALVAEEVAAPGTARAYVVEGTNPDPGRGWPDALAVAPVAARQGAPILLTARDALPRETSEVLDRLAPGAVDLVGGEVAVSASVESALRADHPGARVAGPSRYDTAIATSALGASTGATPRVTWFATGRSFPDALAAGPAVAAAADRLLLVDGVDPAGSGTVLVLLEAQAPAVEVVRVLGGPVAIGEVTVAALRAALR